MFDAIFDPNNWSVIPFHFWAAVFFVFGSIVGSFLNVCIHRMPLGESVVSPPSHCPHCKYSIPWYLNIPLLTWLSLRGQCKNCGAPISPRYFLVETLTGAMFMGCWIGFGEDSPVLAIVFALFVAGLIVATFIDFEHFIIPDEITIGGMVVGLIISFLVPSLHGEQSLTGALLKSLLGIGVGFGIVYAIVRLGKLMFGRQRIELPADTRIIFSETAVHLPDKDVPYDELFYRQSDVIVMNARTLELIDRCYMNATVRLSPKRLMIGDETFNPETIHQMEAVSSEIVLPREAMGFGDVKFMGAIGAFLGWQSTVFALMASSMIGALVGVTLIVSGKREWSSRLPYGPYIALATVIWIFLPPHLKSDWNTYLATAGGVFTSVFR